MPALLYSRENQRSDPGNNWSSLRCIGIWRQPPGRDDRFAARWWRRSAAV